MEIQEQLIHAIQDGIREGIKSHLTRQYQNPLDPIVAVLLRSHEDAIRSLIAEAMSSAMADQGFRQQVAQQLRHKLASVLVARFGGELERQVNALKSDPATRARITLAIEEIVKDRAAQV